MKQVFLVISFIVSGTCFSQKNTGLKLWYSQPSGTTPELKETFLYDIPTQRGQVYTFILK
jgi:hypothetical protein